MGVFSYIMSSIIIITTPLIFSKVLLKPKLRADKSKIVVAILVALISSILIYMYIDGILRTIAMIIYHVIIIYYTYNINLKKAIMTTVLFISLLIISELCISLIIIDLIGVSKDYYYNTFAGTVFSNIVIYAFCLLIITIMRKIFKIVMSNNLEFSKKIAVFSVLVLISILMFFYDIIMNINLEGKTFIYLFVIIVFISVLIIIIFQENKKYKLNIEYEKLMKFIRIYEKEIEKQRILKHEFKNQLITIKSKIIDGDSDINIIKYIEAIIKEEIDVENVNYSTFKSLPSNGLKTLLYFKFSEVIEKGIKVEISAEPSVKTSFIQNLSVQDLKKLAVLIATHIDIAVKIGEKSYSKIIAIEIYKEKNEIKIVISNTYNNNKNKEKKLKKISDDKLSYQLKLIHKILKSNKKITVQTEKTKKIFTQTITIAKNYTNKK